MLCVRKTTSVVKQDATPRLLIHIRQIKWFCIGRQCLPIPHFVPQVGETEQYQFPLPEKEPADPKTPLRKSLLLRTLLPQLFAQFDAQSDVELLALLYTQAERTGRGEVKVESLCIQPGREATRIGITGDAPFSRFWSGNLVPSVY